jgi:hypothetical protein
MYEKTFVPLGPRIRLIRVVDELPIVSAPEVAGGVVLAGLRSAGVSIVEAAAAGARDAAVSADSRLVEKLGGLGAATPQLARRPGRTTDPHCFFQLMAVLQ